MIDLWTRIKDVFETDNGGQPEIFVMNLSDSAMREILHYIVLNSRDVETKFIDFEEVEHYVKSINEVVSGLTSGEIMGEIWGDLLIDYYRLPNMGFYSDEPGFIVIDYLMGKHWNAVNLIVLFEFFRMVKRLDHRVSIQLAKRHFPPRMIKEFEAVLREYVNERV